MIQPVVEGDGDVVAAPELLRRLRDEASAFEVQIGRPIRRPRAQLTREEFLPPTIELARRQPGCSSILILFDGDDDCPGELAPRVQAWAIRASRGIPCVVVVAQREYEAWFLASVESLRGRCGIRGDAMPPENPEAPRGAKEALESLMVPGVSYHETADQVSLTAQFDMAAAYRRSRSFRRMASAFGALLRAEGAVAGPWPPTAWRE